MQGKNPSYVQQAMQNTYGDSGYYNANKTYPAQQVRPLVSQIPEPDLDEELPF